jgi:hypothetical protein
MGEAGLFEELQEGNLATFKKHGVKQIIALSPFHSCIILLASNRRQKGAPEYDTDRNVRNAQRGRHKGKVDCLQRAPERTRGVRSV